MNAMTRGALSAYAQVGVETGISHASPHRLVAMLYEGALVAINVARGCMQRNETGPKGAALSKAIAIIDEGLKISLDENTGGELARNLKALYEYMSSRLLMANLKNDVAALDEVARLLTELKLAWDQIGAAESGAQAGAADEAPQRASVSYGKA